MNSYPAHDSTPEKKILADKGTELYTSGDFRNAISTSVKTSFSCNTAYTLKGTGGTWLCYQVRLLKSK
jgi:hypothetical protein